MSTVLEISATPISIETYTELEKNPKNLLKHCIAQSARYQTAQGLAKRVLEHELQVIFEAIVAEHSDSVRSDQLVRCYAAYPLDLNLNQLRVLETALIDVKKSLRATNLSEKQLLRNEKVKEALKKINILTGEKDASAHALVASNKPDAHFSTLPLPLIFLTLSAELYSYCERFVETGKLCDQAETERPSAALIANLLQEAKRQHDALKQFPLGNMVRALEKALTTMIDLETVTQLMSAAKSKEAQAACCHWVKTHLADKFALNIHPMYFCFELAVLADVEKEELSRFVSSVPRLKFADSRLLREFLNEQQNMVYANVEALELSFEEVLTEGEVACLAKLFPRLKLLDVRSEVMKQTELRSLVANTKIDCLIIKDCASMIELELETWKSCKVFFVGNILPHFDRLVEHIGSTLAIFIPPFLCEDETYDFVMCDEFSDRHLLTLLQYCGQIESLHLENCPELTDRAVISLAVNFPKLRKLALSSCPKLTNEAFCAVADSCPKLTWIDFLDNSQIIDQTMCVFAEKCPDLSVLFLNSCASLTDDAIIALFQLESTLEIVEINGCHRLTDAVIRYAIDHTVDIRDLRVDTKQFSEEVMKEFQEKSFLCTINYDYQS